MEKNKKRSAVLDVRVETLTVGDMKVSVSEQFYLNKFRQSSP